MTSGFSQQNKEPLKIVFIPSFKGETIVKDRWYVKKNMDSILLSTLKFYVTDFKVKTKDKKEYSIAKSNFLIDCFKEEDLIIKFSEISYKEDDELTFNIGVGESLNTSGANSGDLDPSKGMFWSWQSGYINFKIEGKSPSCKTRKNKFQFHIGGYQKPYETIRPLIFKLNTVKNNTLKINLELTQLLDFIELSSQNQIMIPGKEASDLANLLPKMFFIQ